MEEIILSHGAVFMGMMMEGELALITASIAVYEDYLSFPIVIVVALIATQLTDWFHFYIGRFAAENYLHKRPLLSRKLKKVNKWILRYPILVLFGYRFMYGFRTLLPVAIGLSSVSMARFAFFSLLSAIAWVGCYSFLGFYFGEIFQHFFSQYKGLEAYVLLGVIAIVSILFLSRIAYRLYWKKKIQQERKNHKDRLSSNVAASH